MPIYYAYKHEYYVGNQKKVTIAVTEDQNSIPENVKVVSADVPSPDFFAIDPNSGEIVILTEQEVVEKRKPGKLQRIRNRIFTYITSQYPIAKQNSDVADKEYYISWLLENVLDGTTNNPKYSNNMLYRKL